MNGLIHIRFLFAIIPIILWQSLFSEQSPAAGNYALLVGCSRYPAGGYRELVGAANDVQGFQDLLEKNLNFNEVVTLSGWPEDPLKRPTYNNITQEFERLIQRAEPGSQIVILLAGHGFRFPLPESQTDVLDPENPEPDGLDEAFLAADYEAGKNMILDNQIGQWLDRLRARGAHTMIIFDSCFSGTMTRGERGEITRELNAADAGIPLKKLTAARQRAKEQLARQKQEPAGTPEGMDLRPSPTHTGSVVAFYAAQEFETAPEVTRPIGADTKDSRFKHGLLSYHLEQELRNLTGSVSYRDLGNSLVRRYRADGRRFPTPFWEGDLDREVLGFQAWPETARAIRLTRENNEIQVSGGLLAGITKDSILAVYAPGDRTFQSPTGYVRVVESAVQSAQVESVSYDGKQATPPAKFQIDSLCRVIYQDMGSQKFSLWLAPDLIGSGPTALKQQELFKLVKHQADADWLLIPTNRLGIELPQSQPEDTRAAAVLLPATQAEFLLQQEQDPKLKKSLSEFPHALITSATLQDAELLTTQVTAELRKVIAWRNLWKIAKAYEAPSALVPEQDVRLIVDIDSNQAEQSTVSHRLNHSDRISISIENRSYSAYWYCLAVLDGRYGITVLPVKAIPGRNLQNPLEKQVIRQIGTISVNQNSIGTNGFLLLAISQKENPNQPSYHFLKQTQLGIPTAQQRNAGSLASSTEPFEQLLRDSASGRMVGARGPGRLRNPQVSSWSWVTRPVEE